MYVTVRGTRPARTSATGTSTLVRVGGGLTADLTGRPKAVAVAGYGLSAGAKLAYYRCPAGQLSARSSRLIGSERESAPRHGTP